MQKYMNIHSNIEQYQETVNPNDHKQECISPEWINKLLWQVSQVKKTIIMYALP